MDNIYDVKSSKINVVTTDGYTPHYDPTYGLRSHNYDDVYFGKEGKNKIVPNVGDRVEKTLEGKVWVVIEVPKTDYIPILRKYTPEKGSDTDDITTISDQNFRLFYDKTSLPFVLSPETFLHSYSPEATVYRIYRGSLIDESQVISKVFNNSGLFIGHDVPLYRSQEDSHQNTSILSFGSCNCEVELQSGEVCTIAIFNNRARLIGSFNCIIDESTFINQAYKRSRYVTNIYIRSAFIDPTDQTKINYPADLPMKSFSPTGVVVYNDGTEIEHPINGGKFTLHGISSVDLGYDHNDGVTADFAANSIGTKVPLTLSYQLDEDELNNMPQGYNKQVVTRDFWIIVSEPNRTYNVKLFAYPVWISETEGYRLEFYMLNLERNALYPIPNNLLQLSTTTRAFYPTLYGVSQKLTYSINLSDVSSSYKKDVKHVQVIEVILRANPTNNEISSIWEVAQETPTNIPYYGTNLKATNKDNTFKTISIDNKFKNVDDMLEQLYHHTQPLTIPHVESEPVRPSHIGVFNGNERVMIKIEDYKKPITFKKAFKLYENVELVFYKETYADFLTLGIASLTIRK